MALFSFTADFVQLSAYPLGYFVRGVIRTGTVYLGDDVLVVTRNHTIPVKVEEVQNYNNEMASYASAGEFVGLTITGISLENIDDEIQSDTTGVFWISLGLISASATIIDKEAIDELRKALPLRSAYDELRAQVIAMARSYLSILLQKYDQLTYVDEYDDLEIGDFEKEVSRFISKKLPDVSESFAKPIIMNFVSSALTERGEKRNDFDKSMNPFDYESFCADRLKYVGWTAKVTKRSGDQGVDIIADKDGRRVVLQCKLYSQPVGNKAVQEIFAAKKFHGAAAAYVVTNASFTKSAYQLASSLGVELIHHENLNDI